MDLRSDYDARFQQELLLSIVFEMIISQILSAYEKIWSNAPVFHCVLSYGGILLFYVYERQHE